MSGENLIYLVNVSTKAIGQPSSATIVWKVINFVHRTSTSNCTTITPEELMSGENLMYLVDVYTQPNELPPSFAIVFEID